MFCCRICSDVFIAYNIYKITDLLFFILYFILSILHIRVQFILTEAESNLTINIMYTYFDYLIQLQSEQIVCFRFKDTFSFNQYQYYLFYELSFT